MSPSGGSLEPKTRKYPVDNMGPFTVFIRELNVPLQSVKFSIHLHRVYKSVSMIMKTAPGKIKVVLKNRAEANVLPTDTFFKDYRVYIPSADVESVGVIEFPIDEDAESLIKLARGKFKNPSLRMVDILDVHRIRAKPKETNANTGNASGTSRDTTMETSDPVRAPTPFVRVHFSGTLLPDFVFLSGLLIRVQVSKAKPMFCDKCQVYGHTNKFCKNAIKCGKCGERHSSANCEIIITQCMICKEEGHIAGSPDCSHFKAMHKKTINKKFSDRKKSFAEVVAAPIFATPNRPTNSGLASSSSRAATSSGVANAPRSKARSRSVSNVGNKRNRSASPDEPIRPPKIRQRRGVEIPPGFANTDSESPCAKFIRQLIGGLKLSPMWANVLERIVTPVLEVIYSMCSPLLSTLFSMFSKNA